MCSVISVSKVDNQKDVTYTGPGLSLQTTYWKTGWVLNCDQALAFLYKLPIEKQDGCSTVMQEVTYLFS